MNTQRFQFTSGSHFMVALISWLLFLPLGSTIATAQFFWHQTNGPSGVISSLVTNASGDIFAGGAGVFRSINNGDSWTTTNNGLANPYVNALAINMSGHIFVGSDAGVFRSTNNGDSWTVVNVGLTNTVIVALAINPVTRDIFSGSGDGVFRSINNGDSWTKANDGLANTYVFDLAINASGHIFAATIGTGVFRSTNNGDSWTAVNSGLTDTEFLALAINKSGHIFAASGHPIVVTHGSGVFRSTNNGDNWMAINAGLTQTRVLALAINDRGHIFAGTYRGGVFRSTDNGDSWIAINTGLTDYEVHALHLNASETIFAGTRSGGVFRGVDYPLILSLETTYKFNTHNKASDYATGDYRIVGFPGVSNKTLKEFLTNGDQGKDWQVYWDNGSTSAKPEDFLDEYDDSEKFQFKVGRAFWLINRDTLTIQTIANAAPLINQEAQIELHPGWNLITNPFNRPVAWSEVQAINGISSEQIHTFTRTFRPSASFESYIGYYLYNDDPARTIIRIPLSAVSSTPAQPLKRTVWEVEISVGSKDLLDQSTSFGIANEASPELDRFDYRKPRGVAAIPNAYFSRPQWDKRYSIFATDIRPEFADKESWDFEIQSAQREELKLMFSGIARIPPQFEAYLFDNARSLSVNLRQDSLYAFTPAADISNFTVLVGNTEALQERLQSIVPRELSLGQNYPNPFNPQTAIPVTIPVTTDAQLKIYDLLGREVKTLHSGPLMPGRHFFFWNGKDEIGNARASGVYFYRLSPSNGTVLMHKMILMK